MTDDSSLVAAWKDGDIQAFSLLFKRYYAPLCAHAYTLLRDEESAKDIVQQVFTGILSARLQQRINGLNLKGYLFTSVYNRCVRELDNRKRHQAHHANIEYLRPGVEFPSLEKEAQAREFRRILAQIIEDLPKQRRRAVKLYYLEGLKKAEVARQMGIGLDSVKTHLQLALATLRSKFQKI